MATTDDTDGYVRIGDAEELREKGRDLVQANGRHVAVFYHEDEFHAVDKSPTDKLI